MRFEVVYGDVFLKATDDGKVRLGMAVGGDTTDLCVSGCQQGPQLAIFAQVLGLAQQVASQNQVEKDTRNLTSAAVRTRQQLDPDQERLDRVARERAADHQREETRR